MMGSVDGRLIVDRWTEPFDGKNISDLLKHYAVVSHQLSGDAWMEGRVTIQEGFFPQTFDYEKYAPAAKHTFHIGKRDSKRVAIVLDTKGKILYDKDTIRGDNIITILSESVSEEYLEHLRSMGISYLFSGPDGKDIETAMKILKECFEIETIALQGGGIINGAFLEAGLINELSLLVYPGLDAVSGSPSIFEYIGNKNTPAQNQSLELTKCEVISDGVVWLYYILHKK